MKKPREFAQCAMCGWKDVNIVFMKGAECWKISHTRQDHFHVNCARCHYERVELIYALEEESEEPITFNKHGFTCGECNWGRDKYHNYNEFENHMVLNHGWSY